MGTFPGHQMPKVPEFFLILLVWLDFVLPFQLSVPVTLTKTNEIV